MMRKTKPLTDQAKRALAVYVELLAELGHLPSVREFAQAYGVTVGSSHAMLKQLRERGYDLPTRGGRKK